MKIIKDQYRRSRGGTSKLIILNCAKCNSQLCKYQKDGPGILKRIYFDRISDMLPQDKKPLACNDCEEILGIPIIYKKENRKAYRLFVGAVSKHIVKS